MKKFLIPLIIIVILLGAYLFFKESTPPTPLSSEKSETETTDKSPSATTSPTSPVDTTKTTIGTSVEGNGITAYHYGVGRDEILFVGGIHGGYEWNTVLVAYQLMDYLQANPNSIPKNIKVTVIPVLNPDGLKKVTGTTGRFSQADVTTSKATVISGRFNKNEVDLNRNFDCDWKPTGVWQTKTVSGGSEVFSEPESLAIKNYIEKHKITAAVAWYSASGGVFASSCHNGVLKETSSITKLFGEASGYPAFQSFDFYVTTGDMVNWLAKNNIPAISVLLTNHTDTEWSKNEAGVKALLKHYSK